jgi:hypothetical protein
MGGKLIRPKEIAEAVLAASGSLASLLLVFVAFVLAKADSLPEKVGNDTVKQYKNYAKFGLVLVVACCLEMLAAYAWLFRPACEAHLRGEYGFPVVTILLMLYAVFAALKG